MVGKVLLLVLTASLASPAVADDAFYLVPLRDLKIIEGEWPKPGALDSRAYSLSLSFAPRAAVDGGEAYVDFGPNGWQPYTWPADVGKNQTLLVRADAAKDTAGVLYVPASDLRAMVRLKFTIPAAAAAPKVKQDFYAAKRSYYAALLGSGNPGAAWFRYQYSLAGKALGEADNRNAAGPVFGSGQSTTLDDTYSLFAGGRALSENIQLDRVIPAGNELEQSADPQRVEAALPRPGPGQGPSAALAGSPRRSRRRRVCLERAIPDDGVLDVRSSRRAEGGAGASAAVG